MGSLGAASMTILLYCVTYLCVILFLVACMIRVIRYAAAPIHLRWELYPVPHEESERVKHGGSYFETSDWWTKPAHFSLWGELKFMVPEMLFLKGLYEFNRKLWYRSFPFHFGLYLLTGTAGLLFLGAAAAFLAPTFLAGTAGSALQSLYAITGTTGLILSLVGALSLLQRRLSDEKLKTYTTPGDIFNLLFFIVSLGVLSAGILSKPSSAPDMLTLTKGLLSFDGNIDIPLVTAAGLLLSGILVAYIPMTHMSHFIAKYFTYHAVRWDDAANRRGGEIEAKIAEYLAYRPKWAAAHVGADGNKTWAEIATTSPVRESGK
jgi:nitrate reductase gamma subunit